MSLSIHYLEYGRHVAWLRRRRRRAYAPTSNTASHDNHEKINSWVSFCFPYAYGAPLGTPSGRRSSAKQAVALSSPVSTVYDRNAWVFTSLLPSFSQCLVVLGCCLLAAMTKFQGKLASLQQVSSPNSQDNFQICCADMYLVRFLANFTGFRMFLWIKRDFADLLEIRSSTTVQNIRSPANVTGEQDYNSWYNPPIK